MPLDFAEKLRTVQEDHQSMLCVGIDPDLERLPRHLVEAYAPAEAIAVFNRAIIKATAPFACAFKLNFAFFEVLGRDGWDALTQTLSVIPPDAVVIADVKRGDVGNTARFYAESIYQHLGCDACTVSAYMGRDAVDPFLAYPNTATFVLARTSNPGAEDFQTRRCGDEPLYLHVARRVAEWAAATPGEAGLVVGATDPVALHELRRACPALPFLIPGVGAQGGQADLVMQAAATKDGRVLVNSSRQLLYASPGEDFAEAAARAADALRRQLALPG